MKRHLTRRWVLIASSAVVTGCATSPRPTGLPEISGNGVDGASAKSEITALTSPTRTQARSRKPYGEALAAEVADLLDRGGRVLWGWNAHWMLKKGDLLVYELLRPGRQEVFTAPDKAAFAAWLAKQSPRTLSDHVRRAYNDNGEVISHALLAEAVADNAGVNDPTPFGVELASAVADALDRGVRVTYEHRDYCGMGLERSGDEYHYGEVFDGYLRGDRVFLNRAAFVSWLAEQSDESLSGREGALPFEWDNQRITRARLLEAVARPTTVPGGA